MVVLIPPLAKIHFREFKLKFTLNYTYKSYLAVNPHSFRGAKLELYYL